MENSFYVVKNWCDDIDSKPGVYGKHFNSLEKALDFMVGQFSAFVRDNEITLGNVDYAVDRTLGTAHVDFCGCVHYWEVEETVPQN